MGSAILTFILSLGPLPPASLRFAFFTSFSFAGLREMCVCASAFAGRGKSNHWMVFAGVGNGLLSSSLRMRTVTCYRLTNNFSHVSRPFLHFLSLRYSPTLTFERYLPCGRWGESLTGTGCFLGTMLGKAGSRH
ncbi:hypothetical protein CCMA1212_001353 [Trichoderma ghanense]|uniref:Secreted protein n=1 Tax=Trichoderma ghanense TaxID=65468 RepID=A0ABY2HDS7_9HYPO